MLKDRIVEIGGLKRVLLPERCTGPSESYSTKELLAILASDRHSVLITGETGTGKEMLADCVMQMTKRPKGKCQRLNCAGLDSNLVGSELFGHKKGAFTGAVENREGLLKSCDGGVLFLDEIGWLLPDLQARLLRFMETGEIRPIGADRIEHHANVRIVAATNKDVNDGKVMIHDLRARFDFEINLPPIRDRAGDILWFLCEPGFLGGGEVFTGITLRTLVGILTGEWRGNIRELKKYCQRKVSLNPCKDFTVDTVCEEEKYILEDWNICRVDTFQTVSGFAGVALDAFEAYIKGEPKARKNASAWRVATLLAGLYSGMGTRLQFSSEREHCAVVPLTVLRDAANGALQAFGEFDLNTAVFFALETVQLDVVSAVYDDSLLREPDTNRIDLAGAFKVVLHAAEAMASKKPEVMTRTGVDGSKLVKMPVRPSKAFLNEIGNNGPDGKLFAMPPPPHVKVGVEAVLDELGIGDPDRSIALWCNRGFSNKAISPKVGLKPSAVQEHLVKLRRERSLEGYLPKHTAGRKPRKQPD